MTNSNTPKYQASITLDKTKQKWASYPDPLKYGDLDHWYAGPLLQPAAPTKPMPGPNRAQRRHAK